MNWHFFNRFRYLTPALWRTGWLTALGLATALPVSATVKLNGIFSSGMVLQREQPIPVWGTASPNEQVTVVWAEQTHQSVAGLDGRWSVELAPLPASFTPGTLTVTGTNTLVLSDILVGDVFLCSGQSNMAYLMDALKTNPLYQADLTNVDLPSIRHATISRNAILEPQYDLTAKWVAAKGVNVNSMTAVGFYFARELQPRIQVPVGLVLSAWGGTSAEAWTSLPALANNPELYTRAQTQIEALRDLPQDIENFPALVAAWEASTGRSDPGSPSLSPALPGTNASSWLTYTYAKKWRDAGMPNGGVAWLRKELIVPATLAGKTQRIDFGYVEEQDVQVYWNGVLVHSSGRQPPQFYSRYIPIDIPANLVVAGSNVIAVRSRASTGEKPAFGRDDAAIGLNKFQPTGLDNIWRSYVETQFAALTTPQRAAMPVVPTAEGRLTSTTLFNGMIHPILPFALKGVVWYQGEQDSSRASYYRNLLPLMINDWRSRRGSPDLPFLIQQLPNWVAEGATKLNWAYLREAQELTTRRLSGLHYSVAYDVGESGDVHPANKRDVGIRLAKVALANLYGQAIDWHGPRFIDHRVEGGSVRLNFKAKGALRTRDGLAPAGFQVAGSNLVFVDASASMEGSSVLVSSPAVAVPVAARYAFYNDPVTANLTDDTGLPANPVRTDGGLLPVAHWDFDRETTGVFPGTGTTAAAVNAQPEGVVYAASNGLHSGAVSFDAASPGRLQLPLDFQAITQGVFTVDFWFRPTGTGSLGTLVDVASASGFVLKTDASGRLNLGAGGVASAITAAAAIELGNWCHVAITSDASVVRLYQNGVLLGSRVLSGPLAVSAPMSLGASSGLLANTLVEGLQGDLDELRIHPSVLSDSDVRAMALLVLGEKNPVAGSPSYRARQNDAFFEAEQADTLTVPMVVRSDDATASGGAYIEVLPGNNLGATLPASRGIARYTVQVAAAGQYVLWGKRICPTAADDSFWFRIDGGPWYAWNYQGGVTAWAWDDLHDSNVSNARVIFPLSSGTHAIEIAYREDGAKLDRLYLTSDLALTATRIRELELGPPAPPSAATGLAATFAAPGWVNLTWADTSLTETGFRVERSATPGTGFTTIANLAANTTAYLDGALAAGNWYYRVVATNAIGESLPSAELVVKVEYDFVDTFDTGLGGSYTQNGGVAYVASAGAGVGGSYGLVPATIGTQQSNLIWAKPLSGAESRTVSVLFQWRSATSTGGQPLYLGVGANAAYSPVLSGNGSASLYHLYASIDKNGATDTNAPRLKISNIYNAGTRSVASPFLTSPLVAGKWYRLSLTLNYAGQNQFGLVANLDDVGTDGQAPALNLLSLTTTETNANLATDPEVHVFLGGQSTYARGVAAIDNLKVTGAGQQTPAEPVLVELHFEAENATLSGEFAPVPSATASGGAYVHTVEDGTPALSQPDGVNWLQQSFTLDWDEGGAYQVHALAWKLDGNSDSFYVQMDNGPVHLWDVASGTTFTWDTVNSRGVADPLTFTLAPGAHTLRISLREDGARLDKLVITNNPNF
ncbi:MAG: LamG-like jellyroll fold domain-containing protein [Roseimicrobium sp.]